MTEYYLLILECHGNDPEYRLYDDKDLAIQRAEEAVAECEDDWPNRYTLCNSEPFDDWLFDAFAEGAWGVSVRVVKLRKN